MEQKTPLYDRHVARGGKMVPYAGYLLPVEYAPGILKEHAAVRAACGLFDVSHMGEVTYQGKDALQNLQMLLTNDLSGMKIGQARYSPMCNARGGVVDDLLVYRMGEEEYLLVVNAANRHKDVAWMREHLFGDCALSDISDSVAQLSLQGPRALDVYRKAAPNAAVPARAFRFLDGEDVCGVRCLVSRTGYTGEDGLELYCDAEHAPALWDALLAAGEEYGLLPCGLGARDTLRFEAALPLYGHEMNEDITPLEAGLDVFVKFAKPDFIGKQALAEQGAPRRRRVGLMLTGRGIAREGCAVMLDGDEIGVTTSGTLCPHLGYAAAMALVDSASIEPGKTVEIAVRNRRIEARIVPLPFYKRG
ncbi:MAG: glycine cleavage system aminomethyltransferase GcvT [Christensenellales bacterium]|jgi:aminomethyltransferase